MPSSDDALRALGALIRECRTAAQLTQAELGHRAGIVGKYVSEIERGTRDVPFSTLLAIAENGLGLALDIRFGPRSAERDRTEQLPKPVEDVARAIAELPIAQRARVLSILKILLKLALR